MTKLQLATVLNSIFEQGFNCSELHQAYYEHDLISRSSQDPLSVRALVRKSRWNLIVAATEILTIAIQNSSGDVTPMTLFNSLCKLADEQGFRRDLEILISDLGFRLDWNWYVVRPVI